MRAPLASPPASALHSRGRAGGRTGTCPGPAPGRKGAAAAGEGGGSGCWRAARTHTLTRDQGKLAVQDAPMSRGSSSAVLGAARQPRCAHILHVPQPGHAAQGWQAPGPRAPPAWSGGGGGGGGGLELGWRRVVQPTHHRLQPCEGAPAERRQGQGGGRAHAAPRGSRQQVQRLASAPGPRSGATRSPRCRS